jgi:tetratricopeptide (TPR) repeat protein
MRRLAMVAMVVALLGSTALADSVSPEVAQQVLRLLEEAEKNPERTLARLSGLASRVYSDADLAFVMTERSALLVQRGEFDVARAEMATALADRPAEFAPRLRNLYATTLLADQQYGEAVVQMEHWLAHTESPHPGGLFLMGYAYVQLEQFEEAVWVLEQAVSSDYPTRDQWVELLGYAYTRAGRTDEAIRLLEGLIARYPGRARWWQQLAGVYMLMDEVGTGTASLAVSSYIQALPYADARRLARLFAHLGLPADGAVILENAMAVAAEAPGFEDQMLLGELWMLAREFELAVAAFEVAQTRAGHGEPAMMIGQLYVQREEYQQARQALLTSVRAYGEDAPPQAYYLLAVVEINLGNLEAAERVVGQLAAYDDYRRQSENLSSYIRALAEEG